jgi:[ribosomal protein S18]-alanine N-acetyltransferase
MLRLSSSDPVAALAAVRPLVATGGERVQRPWVPESAADPGLIRGRRHAPVPSLSLESESACCRCAAKLVSCSVSVVTMPSHLAHAPVAEIRVRKAERGDVDALSELEHRVFATDQLSRPSLRRFLKSPSAEVIVARHGDRLAGSAIVLFRPRSVVARLYSIAVAPHIAGRGVGPILLAAAEAAAVARRCRAIRLEVHVTNHAALALPQERL